MRKIRIKNKVIWKKKNEKEKKRSVEYTHIHWFNWVSLSECLNSNAPEQ